MGEHDDDLEIIAPTVVAAPARDAVAAAIATGLERIAHALERGFGELAAALSPADDVVRGPAKLRRRVGRRR